MSKVQVFGDFLSKRLSLAAGEIFELFERTIAEYEEQLCRSKEENERQQKLLEAAYKPEVRLHRADVQKLREGSEEVPPEQQERISSLNQEDPPEPPPTKEEEQEELWRGQEGGEQRRGVEEADWNSLTFALVPVKREEDDGEEFQFTQRHQNQSEEDTGAGVKDCGGSEPDRSHLKPFAHEETSVCFQSSDFNRKLINSEAPEGNTPSEKDNVSGCVAASGFQEPVEENKESQTEERAFCCPFCGKIYSKKISLSHHLLRHTKKAYSCSFCEKSFPWRGELETHMRIHTGEKPFSCSVCNSRFSDQSNLRSHVRSHSKERDPLKEEPLRIGPRKKCKICKKTFNKYYLKKHLALHIPEKRFFCLICGMGFTRDNNMKRHMKFQHKGPEKQTTEENEMEQ